jgi:hypothetical protein
LPPETVLDPHAPSLGSLTYPSVGPILPQATDSSKRKLPAMSHDQTRSANDIRTSLLEYARGLRDHFRLLFATYNFLKRNLLLRVTVYRGSEKSGGKDFCMAFAGGYPAERNWWVSLAFTGSPARIDLGTTVFWNVPRLVRRRVPGCHLAVIRTSPIAAALEPFRGALRIPPWVNMRLEITPEATRARRKRYAAIRRRIDQHGFTYRISRRDDDFRLFYRDMYALYIRKKHGSAAIVLPFGKLRSDFGRGELLLILKEDQPICAGLILHGACEPRLSKVGVLNGDFEHVNAGCIRALYYFTVQYLSEKGWGTVNVGDSRPVLSDGPYRFKALLGAVICDTRRRDWEDLLFFKTLTPAPALADFLSASPVMFYGQDDLLRPAAFAGDGARAEDALAEIRKFPLANLGPPVAFRLG